MFFKRNASTFAFCFIMLFSFVKTEKGNGNGKSKEKEDMDDKADIALKDDHTFVALIDIVFTDGTKRSCTGTIIHDNVVITAAHCFVHRFSENILPELTASFVVIGTKKMFDSGYEQYLPIERILTHPKFKGWTADLSLIYTFAAMTSDKPGKVIPLAGEKMSNPVDSNVTVFSWGHCKEEDAIQNWHISMTSKTPCPEDSFESQEDLRARVTVAMSSKRKQGKFIPQSEIEKPKKRVPAQSRFRKESRHSSDLMENYPLLKKAWNSGKEEPEKKPTNQRSRYLTSNEEVEESDPGKDQQKPKKSTYIPRGTAVPRPDKVERSHPATRRSAGSADNIKTYYKNWRRSMGKLQNKLTVEVFGFVNMAACKKIVEGSSMSPHYEIKNGEVACYTSDEHYITEEDSGAPAIRHGHLVAVTVGGAQCDGDHVGVGMKMSCYCSWIADNLPGGGANINCCKNCCDSRNNEDSSRTMFRDRNKYLIK